MKRVFTHWATLVLASAVVFFSASAFSQTVTIIDSNCADFTFGGTAGARTLTCVPVAGGGGGGPTAVPTCSVVSASSGTIGTAVTLTASCNQGPITAGSYVWTGGNCAASAAGSVTCNDSGATAPVAGGVVNYTVLAANSVGTGAASSAKSVTWSPAGAGGGGGPPPAIN